MRRRIYVYYFFLFFLCFILLLRLFQIQVVLGKRNREIADGNRIKKVDIKADRGIIYDRNGQALVRNEPVYELFKTEEDFKVIPKEEAILLEAQGKVDNLKLEIARHYLYPEVLSHVLGYMAKASQEDLGSYKMDDFLGKMGLEEKYDALLRGKDGGDVFEVDSSGKRIREIARSEPEKGADLHLTLDAGLSKVAYEALEGKPGAVVATTRDGQILVLVSSPGFDSNVMSDIASREADKIEGYFADPLKPFFNRAISGVYPPGSTFKIITSVAGLEEGKIDANTKIVDEGFIKVNDYLYRNWYFSQYGKTEGEVDIIKALKRSVDTFYYKVGEMVGPEKLALWSWEFGLGAKTGIFLKGEAEGTVPTPAWKEEALGERWFLGNTYHFAIGQGDLLATPIQINQMTAAIANDGVWCKPTLTDLEKKECHSLGLKSETIDLVKKGLREVCTDRGTAYTFFSFYPEVAGKTGTAQFANSGGATHAWFTGFAPYNDPEIIVTALVEKGGEGSDVAAPIVKKVMEKYFEEK